ncbi:hypothetical protein FRC01_002047 [Tulasnella sp. 417]|nr:hypothetical protein FRC01_002047 [Tulasnella sp. 417]
MSLFPNLTPANEIAVCEAIEIAVRRRRNSRVAINRLAVDIVHYIFAEALDLDRLHDVDFPLDSIETHRKQLFQLRCVSVAWNEFLLASPRYWSAINMGVSSEVLEKKLERARQTPLCLYTLLVTTKVGKEMASHNYRTVLESIGAQVKSIRTNDTKVAEVCKGLVSSRMPLLESLELPSSHYWRGSLQLLPIGVENLRQIKSEGWLPNAASPQLRDLHTLVLSGWITFSSRAIQILAACQNLLTLNISSRTLGHWESADPSLTLSLPRLQELTLQFQDASHFGILTRRLDTPLRTRRSLRLEQFYHRLHPNAELIDNLYHFIFPSPTIPPTLDAAVVSIYGRKEAHSNQAIRVTYSAGVRSFDSGLPPEWAEQPNRFVDGIKDFQTRFNNPPLMIKLINHWDKDVLLPHLANVDIRRIWVTSAQDISVVLALIGSSNPTLPSGTPDSTEWPFESVQELTIEDNQLNAKQLTRIVGIRQRHLRASSRSWLKTIRLVNCHLIGMPFAKAAKELEALGVVLTETGCTYSRRRYSTAVEVKS